MAKKPARTRKPGAREQRTVRIGVSQDPPEVMTATIRISSHTKVIRVVGYRTDSRTVRR